MILVIKHIAIEGPGIISDVLKDAGREALIVELNKGEALPAGLKGIDAIVTLGGPMNVYEEERYPFLKDEDTLLREAISGCIPVLGICLGGQLVAKACGARVGRCGKREIGLYPVSLTAEGAKDPLFKGIDRALEVFQWHSDTFEVPEGAELLATGEGCRNQAFRAGKNAYGLQFHVEVTERDIAGWIAAYRDDMKDMTGADKKAVLEGYRGAQREVIAAGKRMAANFLEMAK